jgi:hexosaminidase
MKKVIAIFLFLVAELSVFAQSTKIIPYPNNVKELEGVFTINKKTSIQYDLFNDTLKRSVAFFREAIQTQSGFRLPVIANSSKLTNSVIFRIVNVDSLGKEGYILKIQPNQIEVSANTQNGIFYAVQSLVQLLPWESKPKNTISLACKEIADSPRFPWRGMMLDCSRYFFPTGFIKKLLDNLALHKINTFHWHLTDDPGWRIEIKAFPELTNKGAYRKETVVDSRTGSLLKFDGKRYGGFYTQQEIKEIVKYAADRFITIVPEIEMPGHAQAAIASYPWLGSTDVPTEVATSWGVKPYLYNPFDTTFHFLEKVLTEVFELFPGEYVHIGGDEAIKDQWIANPKIQEKIRVLGLKNEHELQSWFIRRVQQFAQSRGKKIIGWDEITEGGTPKDAAIMYWRSDHPEPLVEAVKGNHPVVVTPTEFCYFDYYQALPSKEPLAIGGYLTLDKVYSFEPIPSFCSKEQAKQIMGTQANLWTEFISTPEYAEYMLFPRLAALAEVAWTYKERKDYTGFTKRLNSLLNIYKAKGIKYCGELLPCAN